MCESCELSLENSLPEEQLARLQWSIDADLRAKTRLLSSLLLERILQGQRYERLDDFLKVVQASDLSALSNTLNPEMVGFVRRMLVQDAGLE